MFDSNQTVLVIGAHPDDEVLGAGGAISKHSDSGQEVHVLIVTEGATQQYEDESIIQQKRQEAQNCAEVLGVTDVHFGDLPDMRLDDIEHVTINRIIEDVCDSVKPDIVYTHSRKEVNMDHVAVHDSTLVATRPGSGVSTVLAYETPSSTEYTPRTEGFNTELFIDISQHIETKIDAFEMYETETRTYPHPRSGRALEALAKTRGTAAGMEAAETFDVLRMYR